MFSCHGTNPFFLHLGWDFPHQCTTRHLTTDALNRSQKSSQSASGKYDPTPERATMVNYACKLWLNAQLLSLTSGFCSNSHTACHDLNIDWGGDLWYFWSHWCRDATPCSVSSICIHWYWAGTPCSVSSVSIHRCGRNVCEALFLGEEKKSEICIFFMTFWNKPIHTNTCLQGFLSDRSCHQCRQVLHKPIRLRPSRCVTLHTDLIRNNSDLRPTALKLSLYLLGSNWVFSQRTSTSCDDRILTSGENLLRLLSHVSCNCTFI